ncbi:hypothetical protein UI24_04295 [Mycobacteroides franklinii]|nr:hypothetical protein [Mycobacteroides franklinii]
MAGMAVRVSRAGMAVSVQLRNRLELRRSNAAVPQRNRYRERKSGKGLHGEAVAEWGVDAGELAEEDDEERWSH